VFFARHADQVHFSYKRFLENQLRAEFGFDGTPMRLIFRERASDRAGRERGTAKRRPGGPRTGKPPAGPRSASSAKPGHGVKASVRRSPGQPGRRLAGFGASRHPAPAPAAPAVPAGMLSIVAQYT
jgi:hypothetical protein